ncbi:NAD(P)-dependent oxidoreductase [Streptomyces sp. NBC_01506]|uniref:NAD(P)-dependent oxidoreductase n=1 Tax=Streptomyces sp. NBC_01506 TaxID=2903887 RepID=UPI003865B8B9
MSRIIVFGAGGRGGRAAVAEAVGRGHQVTAVVRDAARHADLTDLTDLAEVVKVVKVVEGDVTDAATIARLARGHTAAISSVYDPAAAPDLFYPAASRALLDGLARADVRRLVSVGLASNLETASGALLLDTPGYPQEHRGFLLGHAAGTDVLRAAPADACDWVVLSPSGDFDHTGGRTGAYRTAPGDAASRISYADFAIALIDESDESDEIDRPRHHRTHIGVETA